MTAYRRACLSMCGLGMVGTVLLPTSVAYGGDLILDDVEAVCRSAAAGDGDVADVALLRGELASRRPNSVVLRELVVRQGGADAASHDLTELQRIRLREARYVARSDAAALMEAAHAYLDVMRSLPRDDVLDRGLLRLARAAISESNAQVCRWIIGYLALRPARGDLRDLVRKLIRIGATYSARELRMLEGARDLARGDTEKLLMHARPFLHVLATLPHDKALDDGVVRLARAVLEDGPRRGFRVATHLLEVLDLKPDLGVSRELKNRLVEYVAKEHKRRRGR